jgi:hypothetical protein
MTNCKRRDDTGLNSPYPVLSFGPIAAEALAPIALAAADPVKDMK